MPRALIIVIIGIALLGFILILLGGSDTSPLPGGSGSNGNFACTGANTDTNFQSALSVHLAHNLLVYKQAESLTGVPWEAIAALHYRESNFETTNPSNGEGPFQLHTLKGEDPGNSALRDFPTAAVYAANFLKGKVATKLVGGKSIAEDPEILKDAFWRYNGTGQGTSPDTSAYVMNMFDSAHQHMIFFGKPDPRNGAYTVYSLLKQAVYDTNGNFSALSASCSQPTVSHSGPTGSLVADIANRLVDGLQKKGDTYKHHPDFPTRDFECTDLVIQAYRQAGQPLPGGADTERARQASVMKQILETDSTDFIYTHNGTGGRAPAVGDILVYEKDPTSSASGHVGIIVRVTPTHVYSREANTRSLHEKDLIWVNGRLVRHDKSEVVSGWGVPK